MAPSRCGRSSGWLPATSRDRDRGRRPRARVWPGRLCQVRRAACGGGLGDRGPYRGPTVERARRAITGGTRVRSRAPDRTRRGARRRSRGASRRSQRRRRRRKRPRDRCDLVGRRAGERRTVVDADVPGSPRHVVSGRWSRRRRRARSRSRTRTRRRRGRARSSPPPRGSPSGRAATPRHTPCATPRGRWRDRGTRS